MLRGVAVFLVRCYQRCLSPLIPPCCRFEPTCSNYAIEAFRKKGLVRGFFLTVWRVLRCNPWGKGGYDPVEKPKQMTNEGPSRQAATKEESGQWTVDSGQ